MALVTKTPPQKAPITPELLRDHLRLDADAVQAALLDQAIAAAVEDGQTLTRRQFVQAGFELVLDGFPAGSCLELPRPPLVAVESVTYLDRAGQSQPFTGYLVDKDSSPGRVCLAPGQSWPATYAGPGAVRIAFQAGWPLDGDNNPTTPANIKSWLLLRAAGLYDQRDPHVVGHTVTPMPAGFMDALLNPFIVPLVV